MNDLADIAEDLGEDGVRRVLQSAGANAALAAFNRDCAVRFAVELLRKHVGTTEIRNRVRVRYDVSPRTAFRYFAAAFEIFKSLPQSRDVGSECREDDDSRRCQSNEGEHA